MRLHTPSRGVSPATVRVAAWPVRPVPGNSQLRRGQLESPGHSVPTGQAPVFIRAPHPHPHPRGCPSGVALRQRGRDLVPGAMPFSTGLARGPHSVFCTAGVSRASGHGSHGREVAAALLCGWSLSPAASWVAQQPVGAAFSGLAPGGGSDPGLRCGDLLPSPCRSLSPAARARGGHSSRTPFSLSCRSAGDHEGPLLLQLAMTGPAGQGAEGQVALAAHPDPVSMVYGSRDRCHREGPSQAHAHPTQALPRGAVGAGQPG